MLRFVLIWLLAAALPMQGMAAATMSVCGAGNRVQVETGVDHGRESIHAGMEMAMALEDHASSVVVVTDDHPVTHEHSASGKKCSVCAACCTAAVVVGDLQMFSPAPLAETFFPGTSTSARPFLTAGLERPPRTFFL